MQNLWKHILDYCDMKRPEVIAYYKPLLDFQLGERLGLLIPMDPTDRLRCRHCNGVNSMLSTFRKKDGSTGYCILCLECTGTQIDESELNRWRVHFEEIGRRFASTAKIQGEMTSILGSQAWHLGRRGNHPYLFVRYIGDSTLNGLIALIKQHPKATIVTATEHFMTRLQNVLPNRFIALDRSTTLQEDGTMVIDESAFEEIQEESAGQARKKRGERPAKIELLERAMKEHVFAAYDYMLDSAGRGEIKLLPRPTQQLLAKITNIHKREVSRCLQDDKAKILKLLWEKSLTLDGIESLTRMFRR